MDGLRTKVREEINESLKQRGITRSIDQGHKKAVPSLKLKSSSFSGAEPPKPPLSPRSLTPSTMMSPRNSSSITIQSLGPLLHEEVSSEGLEGKELFGPSYDINIYDMKTKGVVRDGKIWYWADLLFKSIGVDNPEQLLSSWPVEHVRRTTDVEGCNFLVTRSGLLRLIAHGNSQKSFQILESVANGLMQFYAAERVVHIAETARREELVLLKRRRQTAMQEEIALMQKEKMEKRAAREAKRQMTKLGESQEGSKSAPGALQTKSSFRDLISSSLSSKEATMRAHRELMESLKHKRQELEAATITPLPETEIEGDPTEAEVDESMSYIEKDESRIVKSVPAPTPIILTDEQVFSGKNGSPAMRLLAKHFSREGRIAQSAAKKLLQQATELLKQEPNCLEIEAPCHVFGDIHGQLFDFLHLIKLTNPDAKQLWLGDYVDRGAFGCEVSLLLAAAKIKWPKKVFLLRGNHESRSMAKSYNFERECFTKYGHVFYEFMDCFDALPLAAVVRSAHGNFFCVHGGLSPMIRTPTDIERIERFEEPPHFGPTCDLLWSDPMDGEIVDEYYACNSGRGCGQLFGPVATKDFLEDNSLVCIIRAHEVQKEGWKAIRFADPSRPVPMVMTVFSAPNYCGSYENKGAFLTIADASPSPSIAQITWTEAPYALPTGGNAFNTFMPFVSEAIMNFFLSVLEVFQDDVEEDEDATVEDKEAEQVFNKNIQEFQVKVAALRVERRELVNKITPLADSSENSADVFKNIQELDKAMETRRK